LAVADKMFGLQISRDRKTVEVTAFLGRYYDLLNGKGFSLRGDLRVKL